MKYENNNKCCNSDHLKYNETLISCELEHWYCTVCNRDFEVDLEMKRDFKNKRSLKNTQNFTNTKSEL